MHPVSYAVACGYDVNTSAMEETQFFGTVKIGYTVGHSLSLISLTVAMIILCVFRKLHCTRNYIHMHLFMSFILRAVAVFVKDVVLFESGESDHCFVGSITDFHTTLVTLHSGYVCYRQAYLIADVRFNTLHSGVGWDQFVVQYSGEPPVAILSTKPCLSTYLVILTLQRHLVVNPGNPGKKEFQSSKRQTITEATKWNKINKINSRTLSTRTWELYGRGSTITEDMNLGTLWQRDHGH
ncbi:Vasoactive intestinal polypeptide receptor [Acipenser ruthenus]|uniref:Vasoactive intestinal polypeptide receptor n=1 Tax=Acipenser ruthenus TaxID=7906 RepID=A0A662YQ22_ACIRT|nr:Vasoactive intestinal polypeptide receptor [Acipenser ruthenus]